MSERELSTRKQMLKLGFVQWLVLDGNKILDRCNSEKKALRAARRAIGEGRLISFHRCYAGVMVQKPCPAD